mmetsp:Transcript_22038/g.71082  ORF Transcript_22038/g.71082 Transcript_22038/m.71082 type:complete len:202 (+) Transcript_22038:3109-3714(+)|eukprot:scaffold6219_cov97-Isochrysis_galbana.AAC.2
MAVRRGVWSELRWCTVHSPRATGVLCLTLPRRDPSALGGADAQRDARRDSSSIGCVTLDARQARLVVAASVVGRRDACALAWVPLAFMGVGAARLCGIVGRPHESERGSLWVTPRVSSPSPLSLAPVAPPGPPLNPRRLPLPRHVPVRTHRFCWTPRSTCACYTTIQLYMCATLHVTKFADLLQSPCLGLAAEKTSNGADA